MNVHLLDHCRTEPTVFYRLISDVVFFSRFRFHFPFDTLMLQSVAKYCCQKTMLYMLCESVGRCWIQSNLMILCNHSLNYVMLSPVRLGLFCIHWVCSICVVVVSLIVGMKYWLEKRVIKHRRQPEIVENLMKSIEYDSYVLISSTSKALIQMKPILILLISVLNELGTIKYEWFVF